MLAALASFPQSARAGNIYYGDYPSGVYVYPSYTYGGGPCCGRVYAPPQYIVPAPVPPVTINNYYVVHVPHNRCVPIPTRDLFGNTIWTVRAGCN